MKTKNKTNKKVRYCSPNQLRGKTIKTISFQSANVWHIGCSDGTKFSLTTRPVVLGIHGPCLETRWPLTKTPKKTKK